MTDGKHHIFVANSALDVVDAGSGAECAISDGDVLQLTAPPAADATSADLVVLASKGGNECQKSATVTVNFSDLQEMQNSMRQNLDNGLKELQSKQGQGGIPQAPPSAQGDTTQAPVRCRRSSAGSGSRADYSVTGAIQPTGRAAGSAITCYSTGAFTGSTFKTTGAWESPTRLLLFSLPVQKLAEHYSFIDKLIAISTVFKPRHSSKTCVTTFSTTVRNEEPMKLSLRYLHTGAIAALFALLLGAAGIASATEPPKKSPPPPKPAVTKAPPKTGGGAPKTGGSTTGGSTTHSQQRLLVERTHPSPQAELQVASLHLLTVPSRVPAQARTHP